MDSKTHGRSLKPRPDFEDGDGPLDVLLRGTRAVQLGIVSFSWACKRSDDYVLVCRRVVILGATSISCCPPFVARGVLVSENALVGAIATSISLIPRIFAAGVADRRRRRNSTTSLLSVIGSMPENGTKHNVGGVPKLSIVPTINRNKNVVPLGNN